MKSNADNTPQQKSQAAPDQANVLATEKIVIGETSDGAKPIRRQFPGPKMADAALRVAFERRANADFIAHAKESLELEVCGVLAGQICQDDEGPFVHVSAAIRGTAASEASTHVTFTQATWNSIHQKLERDYPNLKIVGWYHTHPGFGVEFSDMDLFIQQNFFAGPAQIAMVTDPLSGAVAICLNTSNGVRYLPRFWVDGREQPCRLPIAKSPAGATGGASAGSVEVSRSDLEQIEARLSQLIQVTDEQRASQHNFMLLCGFVFCLAVIIGVGYFIFRTYNLSLEPPRVQQMIPVPIQVGDKTVMLGVGVVEWKVPDELNAILVQEDLMRKEAIERAAKEATRKQEKESKKSKSVATGGTNITAGVTDAGNPPTNGATNK